MSEFDPTLLYWARKAAGLISSCKPARRMFLRDKFETRADELEGVQGRSRLEAERMAFEELKHLISVK